MPNPQVFLRLARGYQVAASLAIALVLGLAAPERLWAALAAAGLMSANLWAKGKVGTLALLGSQPMPALVLLFPLELLAVMAALAVLVGPLQADVPSVALGLGTLVVGLVAGGIHASIHAPAAVKE